MKDVNIVSSSGSNTSTDGRLEKILKIQGVILTEIVKKI
jgi:hypothetical protein